MNLCRAERQTSKQTNNEASLNVYGGDVRAIDSEPYAAHDGISYEKYVHLMKMHGRITFSHIFK